MTISTGFLDSLSRLKIDIIILGFLLNIFKIKYFLLPPHFVDSNTYFKISNSYKKQ